MRVEHSDISQKKFFFPFSFLGHTWQCSGLTLPLHSGLTRGVFGGTIWGDQTRDDHIQGKQASTNAPACGGIFDVAYSGVLLFLLTNI